MNGTVDACLTVTEGPVIISGLGSAAVDATHTLWVRVPVDREHGFRLIVNTQSS